MAYAPVMSERKGEEPTLRNGLVFATHKEANEHAADLYSRCTAFAGYGVVVVPDEPNYTYHNRHLEPIPAASEPCVVCEQPAACLCEVGGES